MDCANAIRTSLQNVSLPSDDDFLRKYPSQMSVGQAQRVLIAMAVMHRPALLIADEATSALDVITQSEILSLFRELNRSTGMAILYISHDLASVAGICDRIAILHQGEIVECGVTAQIFSNPQHEYTQRLMAAMPRLLSASAQLQTKAATARINPSRFPGSACNPSRPSSHRVISRLAGSQYHETEVIPRRERDKVSRAPLRRTDWPERP